MASPFSVFRKHQKKLMVILVIGSMIAFTGESLFTAGDSNPVVFGVLLGTGLALVAGFQFGRPMEYAIGGALAGGLIGYMAPSLSTPAGIQSTLGAFDEDRVTELVNRRVVANDVVRELRRRAQGFDISEYTGQLPFQLVYSDPAQDVILGEVLRAEADEVGIYVDDEAVNAFIDRETGGKLASKDFTAVRKTVMLNDRPISEKQLYNVLRGEITAKLALETLVPLSDNDAMTPEMYWDLFRRLNVRQQLVFAPVNVDAFLEKVGEPSESEIEELFEKYKRQGPNFKPGEPGFYQPAKARLAYVEADYATIARTVPEVTEEDIQKYYDENKDTQFRKTVVPEDPVDPSVGLPGDPEPPDATPDTTPGAAPESAGGEAGDKPAQDGQPAGEKKSDAADKPAGDARQDEAADDQADDDGGCDVWQDEKAGPAADSQTDKTAADSTDAADSAQDATKPDAPAEPPQDPPATPEGAAEEPKVEYMPLDDDLREQIRNILKRQRVEEAMNDLMNKVVAKMQQLSDARDERFLPGATGKEMTDEQLSQELKKFAESLGLAYAETPLISAQELSDREEYPIGAAVPPGSNPFQGQQPTVVQSLFGRGGGAAPFVPSRAELADFDFDGGKNQFAYWVIAESPVHEPTLDEPGIREQVVRAWKRIKARPLAEKRAQELAAMVREGLAEGKAMSDILRDVAVTGDDDSPKLTTTESLPFSWMRTSSAASPMSMQQTTVSLSQVEGIKGLSNDFMKYVFKELKPSEVGVTGNVDKSVYYVVQPINRFPSDEADELALRERFLRTKHFDFSSPMPQLVRQEFGQQNAKWLTMLLEKYGIDWNA